MTTVMGWRWARDSLQHHVGAQASRQAQRRRSAGRSSAEACAQQQQQRRQPGRHGPRGSGSHTGTLRRHTRLSRQTAVAWQALTFDLVRTWRTWRSIAISDPLMDLID